MPALINVILEDNKSLDLYYSGDDSKRIAEIVDKVSEYFEKTEGKAKVKEYVYHEVPKGASNVCRNCGSTLIANLSAINCSEEITTHGELTPETPFHERLKFYRNQAGLSREELADQIGISASTISKWEKGSRVPVLNNVIDIAKILGIKPSDLLPNAVLENDLIKPAEEKPVEEKKDNSDLMEADWEFVFDDTKDVAETVEELNEKLPF